METWYLDCYYFIFPHVVKKHKKLASYKVSVRRFPFPYTLGKYGTEQSQQYKVLHSSTSESNLYFSH